MVLAIGLLVDDAIVVVENVERLMSEEGLSPLEATRKSMDQITGALVGVGLVLVGGVRADGVPRRLDRRHLPPVLGHDRVRDGAVGAGRDRADAGAVRDDAEAGREGPPPPRNAASSAGSTGSSTAAIARYQGVVRGMLSRTKRFMLVFVAMAALMVYLFLRLPTAFLPQEDQGVLFAQMLAPVGATQERTLAVLQQVENHFLTTRRRRRSTRCSPCTASASAGNGQNTGMAFVRLKDWDQRRGGIRQRRRYRRARDGRVHADQGRARLRVRAAGGTRARDLRAASCSTSRTTADWATMRCCRRATSCSARRCRAGC